MSLTHTDKGSPTWSTPKLYSRSDGQSVADFARTFLHVSKGVRAGQPLILTNWQTALFDALYERREDGLLRYRRSLIGMGRKNGKSLLGSLIALYGLIEGEPGAEVYSAAGDRQQARVVFNESQMAGHTIACPVWHLQGVPRCDRGAFNRCDLPCAIERRKTSARFEPVHGCL